VILLYEFFSMISSIVSQPFSNAANSDIALMAALFLGFIGSVAPCQISANVAAITYFGNRQFQDKLSMAESVMYVLGKITVFSVLGALFWIFGHELSKHMIPYLSYIRKLVGPLLLVIGLYLIGWVKVPFYANSRLSASLTALSNRIQGKRGAFLLGAAFSLGFCPTMFILFFGSLMPLALQSDYGIGLPSVFAVGTAMPFLLFSALTIGFGLDRLMVKQAKKWGRSIQTLAGALFILLGISDTITYYVETSAGYGFLLIAYAFFC
jgi:cytochrome c-type biogenesis protein